MVLEFGDEVLEIISAVNTNKSTLSDLPGKLGHQANFGGTPQD